jgi:hypothetical protein
MSAQALCCVDIASYVPAHQFTQDIESGKIKLNKVIIKFSKLHEQNE